MKLLNSILKRLYNNIPIKKYVFLILKNFYSPPHRVYRHLTFNDWFEVNVGEEKFLMYHYGYELENEIFWRGVTGWEKHSIETWIKLCRVSEVIMDVGANTGVFALLAKSVGVNSDNKVYAFEPVKRVYQKLVRNIDKNGFDVRHYEMALSNYDGEAVIYDQPTDHIYSVTVNKNLASQGTVVVPATIAVTKLSTVIREQELKKIDLIKIDVETHEPEVLEGMEEYLELFTPVLLIEILTNEVAHKVDTILSAFEYEYYYVHEMKGLRKVGRITLQGTNGYNYLAIPYNRVNVLKKLNS